MKYNLIFVILFLFICSGIGFTETYEEYTKLGVDFYAGGDLSGVFDGGDGDMVVTGVSGIFFSPRRILKVSNMDILTYQNFCFKEGIITFVNFTEAITEAANDLSNGVEPDLATGFFEREGNIGFGILSGYGSSGTFMKEALSTINYIPLLASFQQTFGIRKYHHLVTKITSAEGNTKTWNTFTSDYYFGYRISGGPALVINSDYDAGSKYPINLRAEILFGGTEKHYSYINSSIVYNLLILDESTAFDKQYMGSLGINWSISLSTRRY